MDIPFQVTIYNCIPRKLTTFTFEIGIESMAREIFSKVDISRQLLWNTQKFVFLRLSNSLLALNQFEIHLNSLLTLFSTLFSLGWSKVWTIKLSLIGELYMVVNCLEGYAHWKHKIT